MCHGHCLIHANRSDLDRAVASKLIQLAEESVAERGTFSLALAGGSSPRGAYRLLAQDEFRNQVSWDRVELFWGDERSVPPDHPDSNYRMALESFVSHVSLRPDAVHRIIGEADPNVAASLYAEELRRHLGGPTPRFDLILLGLGLDGHTASLFPDTPRLIQAQELAVATTSPIPPRDRVSLTLRTVNAARNVMFVAAGPEKAPVVAQVLEGSSERGDSVLPASLVLPLQGTLFWMLDRDAAAALRESGVTPHHPTDGPG